MLFCSVLAYRFGSTIRGERDVESVIERERDKGEDSIVPAFRTVARLRKLDEDVLILTDCYAALIAKARSYASGVFLSSPASAWIPIDEDVDASLDTLKALREAAEHPRLGTRSCIATAALRINDNRRILNVAPQSSLLTPQGKSALDWARWDDAERLQKASPFRVGFTGLALAWMPRVCVEHMAKMYAALAFTHNGTVCPALFLEGIHGGEWIGEDGAFCMRATAANVDMVGVVHPGVMHGGIPTLRAVDVVDAAQ